MKTYPLIDMTPRYLPSRLVCALHGMGTVTSSGSFPTNENRVNCPIGADLTAVCATLDCGCKRWFGTNQAYIDSHLKMVLVGFDSRDEVRSTWQRVED